MALPPAAAPPVVAAGAASACHTTAEREPHFMRRMSPGQLCYLTHRGDAQLPKCRARIADLVRRSNQLLHILERVHVERMASQHEHELRVRGWRLSRCGRVQLLTRGSPVGRSILRSGRHQPCSARVPRQQQHHHTRLSTGRGRATSKKHSSHNTEPKRPKRNA